jgi:Fic family protein
MKKSEPDGEAVREAAKDRGESISAMEPVVLSKRYRHIDELNDLALELAKASSGFRRSLSPPVADSLATLVRGMNCYYSNLIEGHNTHPIDIERALKHEYYDDQTKRNLQIEAAAHIAVQKWIDDGGLDGRCTTVDGIAEIHRRFYDLLPSELLVVTNEHTGEESEVIPGEFRNSDVIVARHTPVSPGAVPRFMNRFEAVFGALGIADKVLYAGAAHHRLSWIHPFLHGNGRVARLMSHAMLSEALDTGALWSVARGLARDVDQYKGLLANCDMQRRNDIDGRGNLSEEALAIFMKFFLQKCIDQVSFMERLIQPGRLRERIVLWANAEIASGRLPAKSGKVLEALLYRGELPRGEVAELLGSSDRQSRRIVAALIKRGVLVSSSPRAPLQLTFPAALASSWMPGLFPEEVE